VNNINKKNNNIMKNLTIVFLALLAFNTGYSQCTADYDFGDVATAVSPDPTNGESFEDGLVGVPYEDVLHILLPTYVLDIDSTLPLDPSTLLDSLQLISLIMVDLSDETIQYTPEELGLEVLCNNNGDSGNPCTFLGGNQYCAAVTGTPTIAGEFRCDITIEGWIVVFGVPFGQETAFGSLLVTFESEGCMNPEACNYDPTATIDDGSCLFDCLGCTDDTATNYDESATTDNGSCCYLIVTATATDAMCNGYDGEIYVEYTGSSTQLDIYLNESVMAENEAIVSVGSYSVSVSETNPEGFMCSSSVEVTVSEPDAITIEASASDASVLGLGMATADVEGGTGDVMITWSDSEGNEVDPDSLEEGEYTATATDENGCTSSTSFSVLWDSIYNIHDVEFSIFPNPTTGFVSISSLGSVIDATVNVLDGFGRLVYTTKSSNLNNSTLLNLERLEAGSYFISIETSYGNVVKQIQIIR
jgi:hypothetical protein